MSEIISQRAETSPLMIATLCQALSLSRAEYYRLRASAEPMDRNLELRDQIQRVDLEWPSYGYRRITRELNRRGLSVNHKLVPRLMREDNLLCLRKRSFVITTESSHSLAVYPNLVPDLEVSTIDKLWLADITYIRLLREFIYLAVILDAYIRRCIGWALEEVYLYEYESMAEARERIGHFLEEVYNQKRLHSAIGYLPPAEFEQLLRQPITP